MPSSITNHCQSPDPLPSRRGTWLSYALLGVLAGIALGVWLTQSHYDPARWRGHSLTTPGTEAAATGGITVTGLRPMSPPETYDAATLSDKIDGKAELYLSAGFKRLESRRYTLQQGTGPWMEIFVYDMGAYPNAFSVFSRQRRSGAHPLALSADAYQTANGLFLVHGRYYLEIIGSEASAALAKDMTGLAEKWIAAHPVKGETATDERTLFPPAGLQADSLALNPANVFGFDQFDRIFSARYEQGGKSATLFLSRRASAQEAARLANAYSDFLITYGGQPLAAPQGDAQFQAIEILDTFDIAFNRGPYLAGVHEASDADYALTLARALANRLAEEQP